MLGVLYRVFHSTGRKAFCYQRWTWGLQKAQYAHHAMILVHACCSHESKTATDESAQMLTRKFNWKSLSPSLDHGLNSHHWITQSSVLNQQAMDPCLLTMHTKLYWNVITFYSWLLYIVFTNYKGNKGSTPESLQIVSFLLWSGFSGEVRVFSWWAGQCTQLQAGATSQVSSPHCIYIFQSVCILTMWFWIQCDSSVNTLLLGN